MKKLFTIRPAERLAACLSYAVFSLLASMFLTRYFDAAYGGQSGDSLAMQLSGFDALTWSVLTDWQMSWDVVRHPLLALLVWPLHLVVWLIMAVTGVNTAQVIASLLTLTASLYAFLFLHRLLHETVRLTSGDAWLLASLLFAMASPLLTVIAPDHFALSLMLLLLTLYIAGIKRRCGRRFSPMESAILFILTAGVTLSNGLKTLAYVVITNWRKGILSWKALRRAQGWSWHRVRFLLCGLLLPVVIVSGAAVAFHLLIEQPRRAAAKAVWVHQREAENDSIFRLFLDTTSITDSARLAREKKKIRQDRARYLYRQGRKNPWVAHAGKPISKTPYISWTDISTPRLPSVEENLLGESVLLHRSHLLEDTLRGRPVIVRYGGFLPYALLSFIVLLFVGGCIAGFRYRLLWMVLAGFAFDLVLHVGLGFGLNEVYIMGAHWMFIIPIAASFLFLPLYASFRRPWLFMLRGAVAVVALILFLANASLFVSYMLG